MRRQLPTPTYPQVPPRTPPQSPSGIPSSAAAATASDVSSSSFDVSSSVSVSNVSSSSATDVASVSVGNPFKRPPPRTSPLSSSAKLGLNCSERRWCSLVLHYYCCICN
uniref:Uncharacterized protein n=1 Tax=Oryza punctata TaxID=4537 RepID=A0A0E0LX57_ORYPU